MNKTILIIVMMSVVKVSWAAENKVPSLLGLQLGMSLAECGVPECAKKPLGNMGFIYTHEDTSLCWQANEGYTKYKNPYVTLSTKGYFNLAKMASVKLDRATVNPATDKILQASLNFPPDAASELIAMFKDKYGKPALEDISIVQNMAGAQFERHKAIWDFGTARIELDQRYDMNNGMIYLKHGGYVEEMKKTLDKIKSDREKL